MKRESEKEWYFGNADKERRGPFSFEEVSVFSAQAAACGGDPALTSRSVGRCVQMQEFWSAGTLTALRHAAGLRAWTVGGRCRPSRS